MSLLDQLDEFEKENEQLKLDKIELEKEVAVANAKISTMERIVRETTETSNNRVIQSELELRDAKEKLKLSEERNAALEKSNADLREAITSSSPEMSAEMMVPRLKLQVKALQKMLAQSK